MSATQEQQQRERIVGILGAMLGGIFLWRTVISLNTMLMEPHAPTAVLPTATWFIFTTATSLALFVWSIGRITGGHHTREQTYSLIVGSLSTLAVGAGLVLGGYLLLG